MSPIHPSSTLIAPRSGPRLPPDPSSGVFMTSGRSVTEATREQVWEVLVDFSAYHEWNPFVRSQNVADANHKSLSDSSFAEGLYLDITRVHIPPSLNDSLVPFWQRAATFERIIAANKSNYTAAWETAMWYLPDEFLYSERWSLLSEVTEAEGQEGKQTQTEYLSYEVFSGPLAYLVRDVKGEGLKEGFQAQADALKARVESLNALD